MTPGPSGLLRLSIPSIGALGMNEDERLHQRLFMLPRRWWRLGWSSALVASRKNARSKFERLVMINGTSKMKFALCAAVAAVAAGAMVPTLASAQAYGQPSYRGAYDSNSYYDPCRRSTTQRGTGGGLAGAGLGAAIGGSVAGHGAKTEGAVLGGLLGAVIGSNIGKTSAACRPGGYPPPAPPSAYNGYDNGRYDDRADNRYGDPRYEDNRYDDIRREAERDAYRRDASPYRVEQRSGSDINGCTLAESPIYLPDGRVQKRFVRVCPDAQGRYQVVD